MDQTPADLTDDVIVFPLLQTGAPVAPSKA
jgi:hypothetical protein